MRHAVTIALTALALAGVGTTRASAAAYTVTTLDVPGATATFIGGINNAGQVSGDYADATGDHGFVDAGGVFTSVNVPGAASTSGHGINASGQIVGNYSDAAGKEHGFVDTNGAFALIDVPNSLFTYAIGINDSGQATGYYVDASGQHGFVDTNGTFTLFDVPSARAGSTFAFGINNAGQIAGVYTDALDGLTHGFVDTNGTFAEITVPSGLVTNPPGNPSAPYSTLVQGINNAGQVAGSYSDLNGGHNFVDTNGVFTVFNAPGLPVSSVNAPFTIADAINDAGQVAGYYTDATGQHYHGYVADPPGGTAVPEPASAALLAFGLASLGVIKRRKAAECLSQNR